MNMTFKAPLLKEWTLTDESILIGKTNVKLSEITSFHKFTPAKSGNGVIQFWVGSKLYTIGFPPKQKEEGEEAAKYIEANYGSKERIELANKEFRMRCNVCGNIFCYNIKDINENLKMAKEANRSATFGIINAIGGTQLSTYAELNRAERYADKVVDYSKCPKCGSTSLVEMQEGEPVTNSTSVGTMSVADELKKYKDLLDMNVITQDEFDAKKKQLLGL